MSSVIDLIESNKRLIKTLQDRYGFTHHDDASDHDLSTAKGDHGDEIAVATSPKTGPAGSGDTGDNANATV